MTRWQASYDEIGVGYDTRRRADPAITAALARHLGRSRQRRCLDLGCGTGNYTIALASQGGNWTGVDCSPTMLSRAREKNDEITWLLADAMALPCEDASFDGVICTLALHHFDDLERAFREARRVLERGPLVILTSTPEQMRGYWLNEYFPDAMERSIERMPALSVVHEALRNCGFDSFSMEGFEVGPELQDAFLYVGKHHPKLYLDPQVRRGISTFAALADPDEVASGCERLERDIKSGRIAEVAVRYRGGGGDYLFLVAHKIRRD